MSVQTGQAEKEAPQLSTMEWLKQKFAVPNYQDVSFTLAPKSLLVFSKRNRARRCCIQAMNWPPFDGFMLLVIIANCLTLAMDSNKPGFEETTMGQGLKLANYVFIALFTAEAAVKIMAMGFLFAPNTYLRDGWNVLDFIVVCVSFLEFTSLGNFTAIRSIRVLRPLRTITKIPQMRLIVTTLMRSLPMLVDVLVLAAFYFAIFGVTTVQIYAGKLTGRCSTPDFSSATETPDTGMLMGVTYVVEPSQQGDVCSAPRTAPLEWANSTGVALPLGVNNNKGGGNVCPWSPGPPDMNSTYPYGLWCAPWGNPGINGGGNFDTILSAWLNVFQTVTLSDWVFIMYDCQDGLSWWVWPLHVTMVIFGNFFIIALALAVLYLFFVKDREAQAKAAEDAKARKRIQEDMQKRRFTRRATATKIEGDSTNVEGGAMRKVSMEEDRAEEWFAASRAASTTNLQTKTSGLLSQILGSVTGPQNPSVHGQQVSRPASAVSSSPSDRPQSTSAAVRISPQLSPAAAGGERGASPAVGAGPVAEAVSFPDGNGIEKPLVQPQELSDFQDGNDANGHPEGSAPPSAVVDTMVPVHHRHPLRRKVNHLVRSRRFEYVCTAVIILNAIVMALLWYNMPESLDNATGIMNYCFTIFFVVEMALKLIGLGIKGYCSEGMNIFDGLVTVAGLVEMVVELSPAQGALGSYLSVLRAFRLLRVFRLARSWKSLNRIIKVLMSSVSAVCWLSALLVLFIFIWALLGSQFFGYKLGDCAAVDGSKQTCPPGLSLQTGCPATWECYVTCADTDVNTWVAVSGSPYGGNAYCEQFPRSFDPDAPENDPSWPVYLAQVGKAYQPLSNYDNMFNSALTIFQVLTLDDWANLSRYTQNRTSAAAALFYVTVIILGCYMLLNLFLAILLDNLGQITEKNVGGASQSQAGSLAGSLAGSPRTSPGGSKHGEVGGKGEGEGGMEVDARLQGPQGRTAGQRRSSTVAVGHNGAMLKKIETLNTSFWVPKGNSISPHNGSTIAAARQRLIASLSNESRQQRSSAADSDDGAAVVSGGDSFFAPKAQQSLPQHLQTHNKGGTEYHDQRYKPGPPGEDLLVESVQGSLQTANDNALLTPRPHSLTPIPGGNQAAADAHLNTLNMPDYLPGSHLPALDANPSALALADGAALLSGLSPIGKLPTVAGGLGSIPRLPPAPPDPPAPAPPAPTDSQHGLAHSNQQQEGNQGGATAGSLQQSHQPQQHSAQAVAEQTEQDTPLPSIASQPNQQQAGSPTGGGTAQQQAGAPVHLPDSRSHEVAPAEQPLSPSAQALRTGVSWNVVQGSGVRRGISPSTSIMRRGSACAPEDPTATSDGDKAAADGPRPRSAARVQWGTADDDNDNSNTEPKVQSFAPLSPTGLQSRPSGDQSTTTQRTRRMSYTALKAVSHDVSAVPSSAGHPKGLVSRMASTVLDPMLMRGGDTQPSFRVRDFLHGRSLFIFSDSNPLRIFLAQVIANKYFEQTVLFLILFSSVQLALDSQDIDPDGPLSKALWVLDVFFCITFGLEMVFKIIVLGLVVNGPGSYLRSPWNILDALIVAVQVAVLVVMAVVGADSFSWMRAFRALRALRPLRAATRMEGIKIVVSAVFRAIPAVGNVVLVGLLFYFIFSVLAVNLLMGGMFFCGGPDGGLLDAAYLLPDGSTINKTWCEQGTVTLTSSYYHDSIGVAVPAWDMNVTWTAPMLRFDNVPQAVWTLFQMASLEGWADVMHNAQAVVGPEQQPVWNTNPYIAILFVIFIIVGCYFMLNLVIGVSIDKFNEMKDEAGGSPLLTEQQQQWLTIQKLLTATQLSQRWSPPRQRWRRAVYSVTHDNPWFDRLMIAVILANVATMCMVHAGQGASWDTALSICNMVFTGIFLAEMLAKWIAVGIGHYFSDNWNRFDAFVVAVSVLGVILDNTTPEQLTFLPLLRIMRVARIFRLIPKARGLRLMLTTLLWSLPALLNVGSMLTMFMFMYSIMGMNLFGNIKFQENIDKHANFRSFPVAMLMLFRCITGENWNGLMVDCMIREDCIQAKQDIVVTMPDGATQSVTAGTYLDPFKDAAFIDATPTWMLENQCSISPIASVIFFCTFMLLCSYLLLQLVIAVVLDNIQSQYAMEAMVIHQEHIWAFVDTWEVFDVKGEGFIEVPQLTSLLEAVPPPLGVKGLDFAPKRVLEMLMAVDVPMHNLRVHFLETLHALSGRVAGAELPEQEEFTIHNRLISRLPKDASTMKHTAGHFYAAQYVKAAVKGFLARRMIAPLWDALKEEEALAAQEGKATAGSVAHGVTKAMHRGPTLTRQQREAILSGVTHSGVSSPKDDPSRTLQPNASGGRSNRSSNNQAVPQVNGL